ncbi:MAG: hypothetical protein B7Z67_10235 [Acidiphilium sp. 21-60-14]|nr:MAG: hypothetical protein B7Z67_10235 [Acidiphilium sp. 21-60-14]OYV90005.1 MAG: hypothetical protein B7Z57_10405 [Acidiphilium sp. 37-60-79]OZB39057.1 MAG: hypothetical protein B7X48_10600 [Acidiphilium sp. 34-60-192]
MAAPRHFPEHRRSRPRAAPPAPHRGRAAAPCAAPNSPATPAPRARAAPPQPPRPPFSSIDPIPSPDKAAPSGRRQEPRLHSPTPFDIPPASLS